jgi:hypothetical protein
MGYAWRSGGLSCAFGLLACTVALPASSRAQAGAPPHDHADATPPAEAAGLADAAVVTRALASRGFANVAAVIERDRVFVTFENTRFRDLRRALREVAAELSPLLPPGGELVLVPSVDGVPLGTAAFPVDQDGAVAMQYGAAAEEPRTSLSLAGIPSALLSARRTGSPYGRVDVVVHPWFEASFGDYANAVRSRTGVAPEVRVALRRGLRLSAQVLFTLQDDLPTGESRVRPGLVTLSQTLRLPRNLFVHATAGAFTPNRYGMDVQARAYSSSGRWFAGAELGQTGLSSFARGDWRLGRMGSCTALVEAGWRDLRHGVSVTATAGAFLDDQQGIRLDVVRQFGEVDLGWFVVASEEGKNGGAVLRIPVGVPKHPHPGAARIRAADSFRWEYRYYGSVPGGRRFRTETFSGEAERWLSRGSSQHESR